MPQRTLKVNGVMIRSLREAIGLTVEEAAVKAGYSSRTWQQLERGEQAFRRTVRDVATLLGVPVDVIIVDPSYGLLSEIGTFGMTGLGSAVLSIGAAELSKFAAELMYGLAILLDMSGEAGSAASICEALVTISLDAKQRAAASIRLAAIYEHQNLADKGLRILEKLEKELETGDPVDLDLLYWTRYQAGVLFLALDRLKEGERVLRDTAKKAPSQDHRTSARHQLGVIALRRGRYPEARRLFKACLDERPAASFRRAFEYRRIAEANALDGLKGEAIAALKEGIRVARTSGFKRYEQEILKTASQLGLDSDPSWRRICRASRGVGSPGRGGASAVRET